MKIDYAVLWPGGNTTALVTTPLARKNYPVVARLIMQTESTIEQVGFLEKPVEHPTIHLQMMGGEFCGNATRAAAFCYHLETAEKQFTITVSGLDENIPCVIEGGEVKISLPSSFFVAHEKKEKYDVVQLQGIKHCLVPNIELATEAILQAESAGSEAVGVIGISTEQSESGEQVIINPYVWVREMDAVVHETACGSGSIAVALFLHTSAPNKTGEYVIKQPSGEFLKITLGSTSDSNINFAGQVKLLQKQSIDFINNDTASQN